MKKAIILHGMPEEHEYQGNESEMHWIPWLKTQLEENGFEVHAPELPKPYMPDYSEWLATFKKLPVDEETILIGHSAGGGFLVRYLSEHDVKVNKVVLVAPWTDPKKHLETGIFEFDIHPELNNRTEDLTILVSLDDGQDVLTSVEYLTDAIPQANLKQFTDKGHFTKKDMGHTTFPELLKIIL